MNKEKLFRGDHTLESRSVRSRDSELDENLYQLALEQATSYHEADAVYRYLRRSQAERRTHASPGKISRVVSSLYGENRAFSASPAPATLSQAELVQALVGSLWSPSPPAPAPGPEHHRDEHRLHDPFGGILEDRDAATKGPTTQPRNVRAESDQARAEHVALALDHLLDAPLPSRSDIMLVLTAVEPHVARYAVSRLATASGHGSAFARLDALTGGVATRVRDGAWYGKDESAVGAAVGTARALARTWRGHGRAATARLAGGLIVDATRMARGLARQSASASSAGATTPRSTTIPHSATGRGQAVARDTIPGASGAATITGAAMPVELVQAELADLDVSGGMPLPADILERMRALLGRDFSHVRVHTDDRAARTAEFLQSRAFTIGCHVYFRSGHWAPGSRAFDKLLVHELTHVMQHDEGRLYGSPDGGFRVSEPDEPTEREARAAERRAVAPIPDSVATTRGPRRGVAHSGVRMREDAADHAQARTPKGAQPYSRGGVVSRGLVESLVRRASPELADLISKGPIGLITGLIEKGIQSLLGPVSGLLNRASATIDRFTSSFAQAFGFIKGLYAGDAQCCKAFEASLDKIRSFAKSIAENPVVQAVKSALGTASDAIKKVSMVVLSPAFDAVKSLLGGAWTGIQAMATKISGWLQPVKDLSSRAWNWVKGKLGIGGSGDSGGILGWLTSKAKSAWSTIKQRLAPVAGPLKVVAGAAVALSPIGPVLALVKFGPQVVQSVQWLWKNRGKPDLVKRAHAEMGGTFLPKLLGTAQGLGTKLQSAATWLSTQATSLSTGLLQLLGSLTGVPLLGMAQGAVRAISNGVKRLAAWASQSFTAAVQWAKSGFSKLSAFVEPYASVLTTLGMALANPAMIPMIIAGKAWLALPECIKGPIIELLLDAAIAALEALPGLPMFGPLWAMLKAGVIGFLKGLNKQPNDVKAQVANKIAKILSGGSPAFLLGFVKGFATGVWEGLTDPFVLIWSAIKGLGQVTSWFAGLASQALGQQPAAKAPAQGAAAPDATTQDAPAPGTAAPAPGTATQASGLPTKQELGQRAGAMASELGPPVEQASSGFIPAVKEVFSGGKDMSLEQLIAKLGTAWAAIEQGIQGAAASMAEKVCKFFTSNEAEGKLGESVGWLAGTIAFEILLGVLTAGAWQPVSAAGKLLKTFARILDWTGEALGAAFKVVGKIGSLLLDAVKGLGKMLANAGGAAAQVLGALGEIGRKLLAFADELLGRFGKGVAGEGVEKAAKESVSEAGEKVVKEGVETTGEKVGKESVETTGEKAGKESVRESGEQAGKQGTEESGEQAGKQGTEESGEQAGKKADGSPTDAEKARVGALATAEAHALDRMGLNSAAIVSSLKSTFQARYRWIKDFTRKRVSGLRYQLYLIASEIPLGGPVDDSDSVKSDGKGKSQSEEGTPVANDNGKYKAEDPDGNPINPSSGLSRNQETFYREQIDDALKARDLDKAMDIRYERYKQRLANQNPPGTPLPRDGWERINPQLRPEIKRGMEVEGQAIEAAGVAKNNNAAGEYQQHTFFDPKTEKQVTTRPDGLVGSDVVESKYIAPTSNEQVLYDSPQLRAQRDLSKQLGGDHRVVISSDDAARLRNKPPEPRPSGPLGDKSTIEFFDPKQGRITHVWDNERQRWIPK